MSHKCEVDSKAGEARRCSPPLTNLHELSPIILVKSLSLTTFFSLCYIFCEFRYDNYYWHVQMFRFYLPTLIQEQAEAKNPCLRNSTWSHLWHMEDKPHRSQCKIETLSSTGLLQNTLVLLITCSHVNPAILPYDLYGLLYISSRQIHFSCCPWLINVLGPVGFLTN